MSKYFTRLKLFFLSLCIPFSCIFSEMHHYYVENEDRINQTCCWVEQNVSLFEELLISWNASRPQTGHYSIHVKVKTENDWSPWLPYAQWGSDFQKGTIAKPENVPVHVYQDAVEILDGKVGRGFMVKVIAENCADISALQSIHVCASKPSTIPPPANISKPDTSYLLKVQGLSQMALLDERGDRLCSPTSTTAVLRFLNQEESLNPIQFADAVWDSSFDIFGNWVFNVAEAYHQIQKTSYSAWVERLENFQGILDSLREGSPVVISIGGPLPGSAQPYNGGHLIAVIGFDAETNEVICMDPAFKQDEETIVRYPLEDLTTAWGRRKNVAYMFKQRSLGRIPSR
jgi:hypothetical protein